MEARDLQAGARIRQALSGQTARRAWTAASAQRFLAVLLLLVALFVFFSLTQERFFTSGNIDALLTSASILWVVSIGLTL